MLQRGKDTWQLRVHVGIDPATRKQQWLAKTVHGTRRFAGKQPHLGGLHRQPHPHVIDCYITPYFGHLRVGKITTQDVDDFYAYLLRWGSKRGHQPLAPTSMARVHGLLHRVFTRGLAVGPKGFELRPTKNHRAYRVELDRDAFDVLMAHRARAETCAGDIGVELTEDAFLFSLRPDGLESWKPNWVTKQFIAARRAAGLPHFRLHDLRHFMATQMLAAGVPICSPPAFPSSRCASGSGHARVSTKLNVYAHSVPGGDRVAAETIATILASRREKDGIEIGW